MGINTVWCDFSKKAINCFQYFIYFMDINDRGWRTNYVNIHTDDIVKTDI